MSDAASTQARDEKVTVANGMPPSVDDDEEILPETDAGALARALDALAASNVDDDECVAAPPVADPPSSAEPHSRCPTQIARSRNWLSSALDESVRAEESSLDRDLEHAIGDLKQWREQQARRVEMEMQRIEQLHASAPSPSSADGIDAAISQRDERVSNQPVAAMHPQASCVDENACVRDDGSCAPSMLRPTPETHVAAARGARLSASERVERAIASEPLDMESLPSESNPLVEAQHESLLKADAELQRVGVDLLQRASDLDLVLARMHALERK